MSKFLTRQEIKKIAPAVFSDRPVKDVSERYVYIPSYKIIDDMERIGWYPAEVKQSVPRNEELNQYQKHSIRFRTEEKSYYSKVGDVVPEMHYVSSHDRTYRCLMSFGANKLVCGNGLITPVELFQNLSVKHIDINFKSIEEVIIEIAEGFSNLYSKIEEYKTIELNKVTKDKFALKARDLRWSDGKVPHTQLLQPKRKEDQKDDLWTVFNVIQENIIHGGIEYSNPHRKRTARPITNIVQETKINKDLWLVMEAIRLSKRV